jgi:hypothetical protein
MVKRLKSKFNNDIVTIQHSKSLNYLYNELLDEASNSEVDYPNRKKRQGITIR